MDQSTLQPYTSLFSLAMQQAKYTIPLAVGIVSAIWALAWKNPKAFKNLEAFTKWYGTAFLVVFLYVALNIIMVYVGRLEPLALALPQDPSDRNIAEVIHNTKGIWLGLDIALTTLGIAGVIFCTFVFAHRIFDGTHDEKPAGE